MTESPPLLSTGTHRFIFHWSVLKGDGGCLDLNEWFPIEPNVVNIEAMVPFGPSSLMVVATVRKP